MATTAFPLSRRGSIVLGRGWHWRVDVLHAEGSSVPLQLLTAFNPRIEEFRSLLGWPNDGLLVIVARFEYHGTHPGWHCHSACCDIAEIAPAQPMHRQFIRVPKAESVHRKMTFDLTEATALVAAFRFYRITGKPEGMFV